ncbi:MULTISPECIES: hypothetical protein [Alteribacter]|uniref:Uncharacterized protein n=1 Tax=Alteribacter keqinensis TaxID=2483800 RepID=A0A3M7TRW8_9BACI|nr:MULTISPECIES: hypothetical protein [Alteribacter]MBM7095372.1 hypothetical protein [Alteribacter salitolerans]RNA68017.1 hypothetical protein EBO34_15145 [Alteribacter keqinensis]
MYCLCETPLQSIHLQSDSENPLTCSHCAANLEIGELTISPLVKKAVMQWADHYEQGKLTTKEANDAGHQLVYRLQAALDGRTLVFYIPLLEK